MRPLAYGETGRRPRLVFDLCDRLGESRLTSWLRQTPDAPEPMPIDDSTYRRWIDRFDTLGDEDIAAAHRFALTLKRRPSFDVVMSVYDPPEQFLAEAIASVRAQIYSDWTLCIFDDGSTKPGVKKLLEDAARSEPRIRVAGGGTNRGMAAGINATLGLGKAEFVAFLDHDDLLSKHALLLVAHSIERWPDANLIHGDGDVLDARGERKSPYFKPDYDHELFLGYNVLWGVLRRSVLEAIGGMREGFPGSEDYDLSLRAVERIPVSTIRHIPHVLYHWRMVPTSSSHSRLVTAIDSAQRAVQEHCERIGVRVEINAARTLAWNRVRALPDPSPRVTLAIEAPDSADVNHERARYAARTRYDGLAAADIILIGSASVAAARNEAARRASTELIAFVDVRLLPRNADWLMEMTSHFAYPACTAVGARVISPDGRVEQSGILFGVTEPGSSFPVARALHGAAEDDPGYAGRTELAHGASAVTGGVMLVRRTSLLELGGFDEDIANPFAVDVDFCLRARDKGRTLVMCPHAVFDAATPAKWFEDPTATELLVQRWGSRLDSDPYYNPNLTNRATDFGLAFPPRLRFPWQT